MKLKIKDGETWEAKKTRLSNWHDHFALLPRRVGPDDWRWLETIERIGERNIVLNRSPWWEWSYRAKQPDSDPHAAQCCKQPDK